LIIAIVPVGLTIQKWKEGQVHEDEFEIEFGVRLRARISCSLEMLQDKIVNLLVPESNETKYVGNSFELFSVRDLAGKDVTVP
jgi:hypothetical protein